MAHVKRLRQVLDLIESNPRHWNQQYWHCDSCHCFAGFAQILEHNMDPTKDFYDESKDDYTSKTFSQARRWLALTEDQAYDLFDCDNSLKYIQKWINREEN